MTDAKRRTSMLTRGIPLSKAIIWQILRDRKRYEIGRRPTLILFTLKSHTGFRLISKLVTLSDLERLRVISAVADFLNIFLCDHHNLAENWSWARDVNGWDQDDDNFCRDETETRRWYISRPRPQPWLLVKFALSTRGSTCLLTLYSRPQNLTSRNQKHRSILWCWYFDRRLFCFTIHGILRVYMDRQTESRQQERVLAELSYSNNRVSLDAR